MQAERIDYKLLSGILWASEAESSLRFRRTTLAAIAVLAAQSPGLNRGSSRLLETLRAELASESNNDEVEVSAVHMKQFAFLALRKLEADAARRS